jgi:hypothetical protein
MSRVPLGRIAYARSGDKGASANVGVIAYTPTGYDLLRERLSAERVETFFEPLGVGRVMRYELPNLGALNFVLPGVLGAGGSRSLRNDAQGKALGQALLELPIDVPNDLLRACLPREGSTGWEGDAHA